LPCPDDDNELFWGVMLGKICGGVGAIISTQILPDDIQGANQFHAHPYHHLLPCPDDDNELC
jgi:hypothetical protein